MPTLRAGSHSTGTNTAAHLQSTPATAAGPPRSGENATKSKESPSGAEQTNEPYRADALLFDFDGLLVGTEALFTRAESEIFSHHGEPFLAEHKARLIGHPVPEVGKRMAAMLNVPDRAEEIAKRLLARVEQLVGGHLEPLPGVRLLLDAVHGRVPIAIVSNSPRSLVMHSLRSAGLSDLFSVVITLEDAERPKPDPALYLCAARVVGVLPERCLAFEDSPTGVRAALAAGIPVIGVPEEPENTIGATWHVANLGTSAARSLIASLMSDRA